MKCYNIPIFVPHKGCPFDCVFCNQRRITGKTDDIDETTVIKTVEEYLKTLPRENVKIEIAFFGGSFTGIDFNMQRRFLSTAYKYVKSGKVSGIRLSTRPDYIDKRILEQLLEFGVTTIELGVQSMDDTVLLKSNRGHSSDDVKKAVQLIRNYPFSLGLQMMTGLPGDTHELSLKTADEIIALKPDFVRIYPTLVLKDTYLECMYKSGEYKPQTLTDAVALCKALLKKFSDFGIDVIRVALQTTEEISEKGSVVAGPYDVQFRERVESSVYYDKIKELLLDFENKRAIIGVNDREVSKAVGRKKENIIKIKNELGILLKISGNSNIVKGDVELLG